MSNNINFKNRAPIDDKKRQLTIFIILASLILAPLIYLFIYWAPVIYSQLPKLYISHSEEIGSEGFTDCIVGIDDESINASIKVRGLASVKAPKKSYRIELSRSRSLCGMRRDDDWLLFSMYTDIPKTRIKLSFDLWHSLLDTNPTAILPEAKYVLLFMNNNYKGIYLLTERCDRRLYNLDKNPQNNKNSSLIFQAQGSVDFKVYRYDPWDQDWPNEEDGMEILDDVLIDLFDFINNTPDIIFFNDSIGIYSKFNKQNLIDFYVFDFFIYHDDFWNNNFYIVRDTYPSKFFLIPWDFDQTFGQFKGRLWDADLSHESFILENNELYNRLLNNVEFVNECNKRWNWLRQELWTEKYINNLLAKYYEQIENLLQIETNMYIVPHMDKDYQEYIDILYDWISDRIDYCDNYFAL